MGTVYPIFWQSHISFDHRWNPHCWWLNPIILGEILLISWAIGRLDQEFPQQVRTSAVFWGAKRRVHAFWHSRWGEPCQITEMGPTNFLSKPNTYHDWGWFIPTICRDFWDGLYLYIFLDMYVYIYILLYYIVYVYIYTYIYIYIYIYTIYFFGTF